MACGVAGPTFAHHLNMAAAAECDPTWRCEHELGHAATLPAGAADHEGMRAVRGARVVAKTIDAVGHLLRENTGRRIFPSLGAN
jgi:hypothetical protein